MRITAGYDAEAKKYIGTWVDSLSPGMMHMDGEYNKEKKTMTLVGMAHGMDGNPAKHRLTTVYNDGKRVMTMYITLQGGEETRFMQLAYTENEVDELIISITQDSVTFASMDGEVGARIGTLLYGTSHFCDTNRSSDQPA
ncbi:MAG: DUF1579 family protein [Pirellulaceae bacterium]